MTHQTTLADSLYARLRESIMKGMIPSGEMVNEQQIAQEYGVSKLTARETLKRLCGEKMLVSYPRKGYLVHQITASQCKQMQQVRYQVEALAVRQIIRRAADDEIRTLLPLLDDEGTDDDPYASANYRFHMAVARLSGSEYIVESMDGWLSQICRYALSIAPLGMYTREKTRHREIVEAMLARDAEKALAELRLDLYLSENEI